MCAVAVDVSGWAYAWTGALSASERVRVGGGEGVLLYGRLTRESAGIVPALSFVRAHARLRSLALEHIAYAIACPRAPREGA